MNNKQAIKELMARDPEIKAFVEAVGLANCLPFYLTILAQFEENALFRNGEPDPDSLRHRLVYDRGLVLSQVVTDEEVLPTLELFNLRLPESKPIRGLPERKELYSQLLKILKNPTGAKGLYLHGKFGVGKSFVMLSYMREFARQGKVVIAVHFPSLVRQVKLNLFEPGYTDGWILRLSEADVVLFDDIGGEGASKFIRDEFLCPVLQHRMDHQKLTFFTSNFNVPALIKRWQLAADQGDIIAAERVVERINMLVSQTLELTGDNRRK